MAIVPYYTCDNTDVDVMTAMRNTIVTDTDTGEVFVQVYDPNAPTAEIRAGVTILLAAATPVAFSSAMSAATYALEVRAYNAGGDTVGVTISNKTVNGFTATPIEACTFEYTAIIE